jgi:hypothetical protein
LVEETGLTRTELETELKNNPKLNINVPVVPKVTSKTKEQLPSPAPVLDPPASNVLNEKTKEMNDANLPKPVMAPKPETINTTNVMADKKIAPTGPLPSVRNQEPTFANMILYSTRVV